MHAHIEPIAAVVRVFADDQDYGDPYTFAATLRWIDQHSVEVMGVVRAPNAVECRAIEEAVERFGVRSIIWKHRDRARTWTIRRES